MICNNCCGNCGNFQPLRLCHGAFVPKQPSKTQSFASLQWCLVTPSTHGKQSCVFLQEWCVAKRPCLHKHASIAKLSTTLQSFSVVCKIKRATAHCTYKMNVTVFPQLTVLKQKCTKQRLDACFFHCPKACANVKRSHCPNYKKVAPVCVVLLKLQRSNAKK